MGAQACGCPKTLRCRCIQPKERVVVPPIQRGDYIIQHVADDRTGRPWFVQEVALLDMGRFSTEKAAVEFREFLEDKYA
jgi:hypothetical protein